MTQFGVPVSSATTEVPHFGIPKTSTVNGVELTQQDLADKVVQQIEPGIGQAIFQTITNPLANPAALRQVGEMGVHVVVESAKDVAAFGGYLGRTSTDPIQIGANIGNLAALEAQGEFISDTEKRVLRGAALVGSIAGDGAMQAVKMAARPVLAQLANGAVAGALYGLIAPKEGHRITDAIMKDALIFGGLNLAGLAITAPFRTAAPRLAASDLAPSAEQVVQQSGQRLTDDAINDIIRSGRQELRAEAIAQTRGVPVRELDTFTRSLRNMSDEQLNKLRTSHAERIEELRGPEIGIESRELTHGERRDIGRNLIAQQAIDRELASRAIGGIERAMEAGGYADAAQQTRALIRQLEDLKAPSKLADGTGVRLAVEDGMVTANRSGATASGRTIQESLDNLANQTGSNVGASTSALEKLLASERGSIELGLRGQLIPDEYASRLRIAEHPRDIFLYGRFVAPMHTLDRFHPVAKYIRENAVARRQVQDQVYAEWRNIIERTKKDLAKNERIELGQLLDSYVRGEDLPTGTPEKLAKWFGEWRTALNSDREKLRKLVGGDADWGIDAYFMHVFAGDWQIVNAATGGTVPGGFARNLSEAVEIAKNMLAKQADLNIEIKPKEFVWESDAATELGNKAYQAFISHAQKALHLSREDVVALARGVTKPKGRTKFWGHTLKRESELPGFLADPTEAASIYAHGLGRKLAFHNFGDEALGALERANLKGNGMPVLHDALESYISRVLGRPGKGERAWNNMVNWAFSATPLRSVPGVGAQTFRARQLSATVRKLESMWRLGYSPLSSFVNLSQTLVNTSSKIGYKDTIAATRQLLNAAKLGGGKDAAFIDRLLVEMDIEFAVPLSAAGDAFGAVHKTAPWSPLYLFNKAENVNRSIAGLAGYNRAIRQGLPHEKAVIAGKRLSDDMNFIYSVEDLPPLLSGPAGQVLGQFKPFLVNELHFIAGLRGAEIPRFIVNLTAAGGVVALLSVPVANVADVLVGEMFGERASEFLKRKRPRAARGILGLMGFDAEQSVAINSIMAGRTFSGAERSAWDEVIDLGLGPGAKDAYALALFAANAAEVGVGKLIGAERIGTAMTPEEKARYARQLMPVMARRLWDAYQVATNGVVVQPTTGKPIFTPANVGKEAFLTATGFRSIERAEAQREIDVTNRIANQIASDRRALVGRILELREAGKPREAMELRRRARERGLVITNTMLNRARDEKEKEAQERALQRIPARQRREVERRVKSTLPSLRPNM